MVKAELQPDLRRKQYLFLGPAANGDSPGRLWPIADQLLAQNTLPLDTWYLRERQRSTVQVWRKAALSIFGKQSLGKISDFCANKEEREEQEPAIYGRLRDAFAQRHRINLTDQQSSSQINYGITLTDTRDGEMTHMTTKEADALILDAVRAAKSVIQYIENPQVGVLGGIRSALPGSINDIMRWETPVQHLFALFDPHNSPRFRYESLRLLNLADVAIELLLNKNKIDLVRDEFGRIFDNHLFIGNGPQKKVWVRTKHEKHTFSVEGVEILNGNEKFKPDPFVLYTPYDMRQCPEDVLVRWEEEPKGIAQMMLKMIRNDTLDPRAIRDAYRMSGVFLQRSDIPRFIEMIKVAAQRAGNPMLECKIEENTLDGGKYEGAHEGRPAKAAGSSAKYQVMRVKIVLQNMPEMRAELSLYTIEADINYRFRDGVSVPEYLLQRQILYKPDEVNAGVFDYLYPPDIYHINFRDYLDALARGIRDAQRQKAFIPNDSFLEHKPRFFGEGDITAATARIAQAIQPDVLKNRNPQKWPKIIVAIGSNCISAADKLKNHFGAEVLHYDSKKGINIFMKELRAKMRMLRQGKQNGYLSEEHILFLDDITDEAKTMHQLRSQLPKARFAVLALREDSQMLEKGIIDYFGTLVKPDEYVVFPSQHQEQIYSYQSAYALVWRKRGSRFEVLIQKEADGAYKLPGGGFKAEEDNNTLETLRREVSEELGEEMKNIIALHIENAFPLEVDVALSQGKQVPANKLYLRGYMVNGSQIDINKWIPHEESEVVSVEWMPIHRALQKLTRKGSRKLLQECEQWLRSKKQ